MNLFPVPDFGAAWRWAAIAPSVVAATYAPPSVVAQLASARSDNLIRYARASSAFYAERFRHLPEHVRLDELPIVDRAELMAHFDQWVTDPAIRLTDVAAFIADPARCGEPFLDRYAVWTSSGTTGVPGIYLSDSEALTVYEALLTLRAAGASGAPSLWKTLLAGGRMAMIAAREGHFAGIAAWERAQRQHPWMRMRCRSFSVTDPIADLVAALNAWQPSLLASYPSMLSVLGDERESGRLNIEPTALWSGGEELVSAERARLERTFGCRLHEEYAASECMNIAFSCEAGTLHLHADWVILEPVDERGRRLPAGQPSAGVLLTNLCNRVQPLIRYQLGDSVTMMNKPCPCGCALPGLRVEGRRDDVLQLPAGSGATVSIVPLAIESVLEDRAGIHQYQLCQIAADTLSIRLTPPALLTHGQACQLAERCLREFLSAQGAGATRLRFETGAPVADPVSGKLHKVRGLAHPKRRPAGR